jgi:hypothetical protein
VPTVTSLAENFITDEHIIIRPNPFNERADVFIANVDLRKNFQSVWLEDLSGRKIEAHFEIDSEQITIYRNQIRNGIYILRLKGTGGEVSKKVMVY